MEAEDVIDRYMKTLREVNPKFNTRSLESQSTEGELRVQIDYSENYASKTQCEIQSVYIG